MTPTNTTLDTLCNNYGVVAARCQYFGKPHPYIVDGMAAAMKDNPAASWYVDMIASALRMVSYVDEFEFRVVLPSGNTILVMESTNLSNCYIAVLYRTGSAISKSIRRMIRRQFRNFTQNSIQMEPTELKLGDNALEVPTHFTSGQKEG